MSIAIDVSSPARFTGTPSNGTDITSTSFTPPLNSLLVCCISADSSSGSNISVSVSDSFGFNWVTEVERDKGTVGANDGHASIWTAVADVSQSITVSVRRVSGTGGSNRISVKVYVITGIDTSNPVGATGNNSSTTNNLSVTAYTSTVDNSRGIGCATDWSANGAGTTSPTSTDEEDAATYSGGIDAISIYKLNNTTPLGTNVTMNFDSAGINNAVWNWVAIEILPEGISVLSTRRRRVLISR